MKAALQAASVMNQTLQFQAGSLDQLAKFAASGKAATASDIAVRNILSAGSPFMIPSPKMTAQK